MEAEKIPGMNGGDEQRALRKQTARACLLADRVQEALEIYLELFREAPEDPEVHLAFGDCYLAAGEAERAAAFYRWAGHLAPDNPQAASRAALARAELGADEPPGPPALDEAEVARLAAALTGEAAAATPAELERAERWLREVLRDPQPAARLADRLEEVDRIVPALLALNLRRALEQGQPDVARDLETLLNQFQAGGFRPPEGRPAAVQVSRVALVAPASAPPPLRLQAARDALHDLGLEVRQVEDLTAREIEAADLVVAYHPHVEPSLVRGLALCHGLGVPVVVDLAWDYEVLPVAHPDYSGLGLTTLPRARAYAAALLLADLVTAPTAFLADKLRQQGYPARVLPDALPASIAPPLERPAHEGLCLGWLALPGEVDDGLPVRRVLRRLLREHPQACLLVAGGPEALALFEDEAAVRYRPWDGDPAAGLEILAEVDLLVVPLRQTPFNQSKSDLRLLLAGLAGVPWVASSTEPHQAWASGGLLARTPDEWYRSLKRLLEQEDERSRLAQQGRERASSRDRGFLAGLWGSLLEEAWSRARREAAPLTTESLPVPLPVGEAG